MIRGGVEYGLGIFITGVDKDSVADKAGLMVRIKTSILQKQWFFFLNFFNFRLVTKFWK